MPLLSEKELEERVTAAGKSLVQLPSSLDELLPLLDRIEGLLSKVEQSPAKSMHAALSPLMKALVMEDLLKHSDVDVRVGVASCISEITRITAPDAPYDDDKMKDVCQLIVSSFENLSDMSNRSYEKRANILETVAKVRSCVIMLDLECDQMIIEMFQHFLKAIRDDHPKDIYTSMETIMTLVLEESEDISADLLAPILSTLKRNNEAVMPIAKRLAEQVIESSVEKLRPYIREAVKSLDASLDDYSEVVASACRENTDTVGHSNESSLNDQLVVKGNCTSPPAQDPITQVGKDDSEEANIQDKDSTASRLPRSVVSNGISETGPEKIMTDVNSSKTAGSNHQLDAKSTFKIESDDSGAQKTVISEATEGLSKSRQVPYNHEIPEKDVHNSPTEVKPAEAAKSLDKKDSTIEHSLSDTPESEAITVPFPAQSGSHPDESRSETDNLEKGNLVSEEMVSVDTISKKASEGESLSEAKTQQYLGKKGTADLADKDKILTEEIASRNNDSYASDSETQSLEHAEKEKRNFVSEEMVSVDIDSKKASEGESISEAKKQRCSGKIETADSADKDKPLKEEVASKNDDGCASDSEGQTLDYTEKRKGNLVGEASSKKASEGESVSEAKKQRGSGKVPTADSADKDKTLTEEVASKNDEGSASDSEPRSPDQAEKGKRDLVSEEMVSVDTASKRASEGESISEAKKQWHSGKKQTADSAEKDKTLTEKVASKNDDGCASESEAGSLDQAEKGKGNLVSEEVYVDIASKKASEGESISEAKKQNRRGKKRSADSAGKDKTLTEEVASKKDDGCASDSKARSPSRAKKGKGNFVSEQIVSVDTASKRTSKGESISEAKKQRFSGKKRPADKDKTLTEEVALKDDDGCASDPEPRALDRTEKRKENLVSEDMVPVNTASRKASEGESISEAKKRQSSGKKRTAHSADKGKTLTVEDALKNDDGCASDSEAPLLDRVKKGKGNMVSVSVDTASKKASERESISEAKKRRRLGKKRTTETADKGKTMTVEVALKNDDDGASDSEARSLEQAEKMVDARNKTDYGSSLRREDSKKSGRAKHTSEKDVSRSAREDHDKETITSWKSPLKSTRSEGIQEESQRTSNKRKQTSDKEKTSETPEYGKNLIGSKVRVWWPKDQMFYEGEIASFDPVKKKHKVLYNDGDEEVLYLKKERWELIGADLFSDSDQDVEHSSHDTSSDMKRKKKGNTIPETSSKRQRVEGSPKSKLKDTAPKSGGKSKDQGKAESDSKPGKKSVEDTIKSKDQTQKSGSKSQADSAKASSKSKDDAAKVSSYSRQDSAKISKSKDKTPHSGKTPQSGKTSSSTGTKMTKSSSSKVKETDLPKEKTAETAKSSEMAKGKSTDTAKSRESEAKVGKKRRR